MNEGIRVREDPVQKYFAEKNIEAGFEGKEIARFTLGFDHIFPEETSEVLVAEVNGSNAGNDIPDHRTRLRRRVISPADRLKDTFVEIRNQWDFNKLESKGPYLQKDFLFLALFIGGEDARSVSELISKSAKNKTNYEETCRAWMERWSTKFNKEYESLPLETFQAFNELSYDTHSLHQFDLWKRRWKNKLPLNFDLLRKVFVEYSHYPASLKHSFVNPPYLAALLSSKFNMPEVITPEHRIPTCDGTLYASPTGYWIAKPGNGSRQRGILVMSDAELLERVKKDPYFFDAYVVQVLKKTKKPDGAPRQLQGHNAFMRLRLDIIYRKTDEGKRSMQIVNGDAVMCVFGHKRKARNNRDLRSLPNFANIDFDGEARYFKPSKDEITKGLAAAMDCVGLMAEKLDNYESQHQP